MSDFGEEHPTAIIEWQHGMIAKIGSINKNMAWFIDDPEHSSDEERVILLGMSQRMRLLIVCHAFYAHEQIIRIISARKATKTEQHQYIHYDM